MTHTHERTHAYTQLHAHASCGERDKFADDKFAMEFLYNSPQKELSSLSLFFTEFESVVLHIAGVMLSVQKVNRAVL